MTLDNYQNILWRIYPSFQFRHEIFNETLQNLLTSQTKWIDIGCGNNSIIRQYGKNCKLSIGLDIIKHRRIGHEFFIQADFKKIPLPSEFADLITLRMVVEHMDHVAEEFHDIERVLTKGGKVVILTTNIWSPIIFITKVIPYKIRKTIIRILFNEEEQNIFPTFHHINSPLKMKKGIGRLKLVHLTMIEQTSLLNPILFFIFLVPLIITHNNLLKYLRSNILATFEKI